MAIRTRVTPINRDVMLRLCPTLDPKERSRRIADYARTALAEAQETNRQATGGVPEHTTFVDGREGAPLESVNPDNGVIVFRFELVTDLLAWIDKTLQAHSPVRSGRYQRSHVLIADGTAVDPEGPIPDASEYVFVNTQPYARKIERGMSRQAPDGVYEAVAALASKRFGNVARIRFGFRSPLFGDIDAWASRTGMKSSQPSRNRPGAQRRAWLNRQPAIVVTR